MDTKAYDLYGLECDDINIANVLIENVLQVEMVAYESDYHCGEYFCSSSIDIDEEHFILQKNYDDFEDEWTEEVYSQYPLLLYVNDTLRSDEIVNLFAAEKRVTLLKHQEL